MSHELPEHYFGSYFKSVADRTRAYFEAPPKPTPCPRYLEWLIGEDYKVKGPVA